MTVALLSLSRIRSPEEVEAAVEPMAGRCHVESKPHSPFLASLRLAAAETFGFMEISLSAFGASLPDGHPLYSLNLASSGEFRSLAGRSRRSFGAREALFTHPGEPFELESTGGACILALTIPRERLDDYARRTGQESSRLRLRGPLRLEDEAGSSLMRHLAFVRGELAHGGGLLATPFARSETGDSLMALLLRAVDGTTTNAASSQGSAERAAEYLRSNLSRPISRTELAEIVDLPIRSLSRAFRRRYGMGPIAFLRQCRLEGARDRLLAAEPGSTTVTEVAVAHGLDHLGRFAANYRRAFGELPSESLRKRPRRNYRSVWSSI